MVRKSEILNKLQNVEEQLSINSSEISNLKSNVVVIKDQLRKLKSASENTKSNDDAVNSLDAREATHFNQLKSRLDALDKKQYATSSTKALEAKLSNITDRISKLEKSK